jgi:methyl-accepting chemotaxis protein
LRETQTILVAFVALTGIALVAQAAIMLTMLLAAKKTFERLRQDFDELRENAMPFFTASRDALTRIAPKIEPITNDLVKATANASSIAADLAQITTKVRAEVESAQVSTAEITERVKHQAARIDSMVTSSLDAADRAGEFIQTLVSVPARQLAGILAAARAMIESLSSRGAAPGSAHTSNDHETFI